MELRLVMQVDNLDELKKDKELFEKVLLAYYYSVPSDSDRRPDQINIRGEHKTFFGGNLIQDSVVYGYSTFTKYELEKYLVKLRTLQLHEDDIIDRIDNEEK